jgi:hypothetical protein
VRTARVQRGRSAIERAGEMRAEANNLRLVAEAILGSLNTSQELDTALRLRADGGSGSHDPETTGGRACGLACALTSQCYYLLVVSITE